MQKLNLLADLDGRLVYPGDEIELIEFFPALGEEIKSVGIVTELDGKFYLNNRELWLLDYFKLTKEGNGRNQLLGTDSA